MNNKLLVGGIFCDLQKAFDCVNHDILLYKLKFYGISDKALQLYQSYLGNRYCRTAIYNDNESSNKVSNWAKVRHGVPQGSILGLWLFLLYRVIQEESAILWEMIVCVILRKNMTMGPILNGYRDMVKRRYGPSCEHEQQLHNKNNITTNITCIVIRRVNHHVLLTWKTVSERL